MLTDPSDVSGILLDRMVTGNCRSITINAAASGLSAAPGGWG